MGCSTRYVHSEGTVGVRAVFMFVVRDAVTSAFKKDGEEKAAEREILIVMFESRQERHPTPRQLENWTRILRVLGHAVSVGVCIGASLSVTPLAKNSKQVHHCRDTTGPQYPALCVTGIRGVLFGI